MENLDDLFLPNGLMLTQHQSTPFEAIADLFEVFSADTAFRQAGFHTETAKVLLRFFVLPGLPCLCQL